MNRVASVLILALPLGSVLSRTLSFAGAPPVGTPAPTLTPVLSQVEGATQGQAIYLPLLLVSTSPSPSCPTPTPTPTPTPDVVARVTWVIDGDTVVLENGERLRYIGIDAPELDECYGQEALWADIDLVKGKTLALYFDRQLRDRYDRLLAYAYLPDGTFVNQWLVQQGYARAMIISPNIHLGEVILDAEDEARTAGRGLWRACPTPIPAQP